MPPSIHVSVIVPSYRSMPLIFKTLEALMQQIFEGNYEIIVVDSSGDNTAEQIKAKYPDVRVLASSNRLFPGAARNRGIDQAKGEIIALVDADAQPAKDWLKILWRCHREHPEWVGIGGSIDNANQHNFIARIGHLVEFSGYTSGWPARDAPVMPTCNLSFKRSVFDRGYRFLESFLGNEDVEFSNRIRQEGKIIRFIPEVKVQHFTKTDFINFCYHMYDLGESAALARRIYELPGSWLTRIPLAWMLTPFIKVIFLWKRALTHEKGALLLLMIGFPWIIYALWYWMLGFRKGINLEMNNGKNHNSMSVTKVSKAKSS